MRVLAKDMSPWFVLFVHADKKDSWNINIEPNIGQFRGLDCNLKLQLKNLPLQGLLKERF